MRIATAKGLKKKCDDLWSKIIRDIGQCERCHYMKRPATGKKLEAAHIMSRRFGLTRHDLENGICLCTGCHMWAHQNPRLFEQFIDDYLGEGTYSDLEYKAKNNKTKIDYKEVYEKLSEIFSRL